MGIDRRKFMKVAGVTALGLGSAASGPARLLGQHESETAAHNSPVGKRLAMAIDLKRCQEVNEHNECKDCIVACHKTHNVPEINNPKDEIKWIWKEHFGHAFHGQDHEFLDEKIKHGPALLLCNHCEHPPCVKVCPTQATWKREEDGIVMMDWHRCIGCRYCVAACPYGSRSFNWKDPRPFIEDITIDYPTRMRGVVEKCTFCEELLAKGQLPACTEACKENAIFFGDLGDANSEIRKVLETRFSIRRKPELGTGPEIYYMV